MSKLKKEGGTKKEEEDEDEGEKVSVFHGVHGGWQVEE